MPSGKVAGAAIDVKAGRGALIGAATGAVTGGLIGAYLDRQAAEIDAIPDANVERSGDLLTVAFPGDLLYASGCRQVLIGFETPRRAGLVGMDRVNWKAGQHARYRNVIAELQGRGVSVCGCFIVGLDTDTPDIFDEIRQFVEETKLLEVQVTILTPFPGTRLYRRLEGQPRWK